MISIITATYNRAGTLQRAIDSVLAQTIDDWELIVVDDGSTDGTAEVLARYSDPRIRTLVHPANRGQCAAKNTGFDNIRGEWFTLLDSDDEMMPVALAEMLECAVRTGATAITCNGIDAISGQITGRGLTREGWLTIEDTAQCRGDYWGMARTELLGDKRLDPRLPALYPTVWLRIDAIARRYYMDRALLVVHTEGVDRDTVTRRSESLAQKVATYVILGEDRDYLDLTRRSDPSGYRRLMWHIYAARVLRHVLKPA